MKKKVALLANGWNGENLDNFIKGFNEFFVNDEVDLFVFTSLALGSQSPVLRRSEDSIYSLPEFSFFDVVIVFCSGINSDEIVYKVIEKCKVADVPVILQGEDQDGISSVTLDNQVGMKALCEHLIEKHNVKDVVYIAGSKDNEDSNLRMQVLKESLDAHGYELPEDSIVYANWEPRSIYRYITETYGEGRRKLPDAFVCANDQMAIFVLLFLEQLGYKLPDDVIVTGFDNLNAGRVYYPSLATVDQRFIDQGSECAKLAYELIFDKRIVKKSVISSVASFGESCGCVDCKGEERLRRQIGRNVWTNKFTNDNISGRVSHIDMCIMSTEQFEDIQKNMKEDLFATSGEETDDFHIYVNSDYKELAYMDGIEEAEEGTYFTPVMDVIAAKADGVVYEQSTMDCNELLIGYNGEGKAKTYVFKVLIVEELTAGYMVMGYTDGAIENRKYNDFSGNLGKTLTKYQRNIDDFNRAIRIQEQANIFLRQTVEALASAVDAKDSYTHGHSARVAKYAKKIAELTGMSEEECDDIYLTGLLHDIGKIGISDEIINKKGKLTNEEFNIIKQHPVLGEEILAKIQMSPSLSIGARHHHERYDGKGYPDNLSGEDIPQIARIIAVADAYDAMTSKRSYRDLIPQMYVREELVKGMGTQFDPEYAKIMIHLLDKDEEYKMKENRKEEVFGADLSYTFDKYKEKVSASIRVTDCPISVSIQYEALEDGGVPTILFYDSADAVCYLEESSTAEEMDFVEFASICMEGSISADFVRKVEPGTFTQKQEKSVTGKIYKADICVVKQEDHFLVKIKTDAGENEIVLALYDASRYLYMTFAGAHCRLDIIDVDVADKPVADNFVPRIAQKISYIDVPDGDIPNIQVDGWRANHSEVIEVVDKVNVSFHTLSLPSSRRIWHCPIVCIFTSDDGTIDGANYKEVALARLDGEVWCDDEEIVNITTATKGENFENWSIWKQKNRAGIDCEMSLSFTGDTVYFEATDGEIRTVNQTKLPEKVDKVYCYLTGDQCAITNIRINKSSVNQEVGLKMFIEKGATKKL